MSEDNKEQPKAFIDVTSYLMDGFGDATDDELLEILQTGLIYRPYVPLQVTPIEKLLKNGK